MPTSIKTGELELSALKQDSGAPPRVLAADDQEPILEALELLLRPEGYKVDKVRSPGLVREALASNSYDAVLIDLNYTRDTTSGREGREILSRSRGRTHGCFPFFAPRSNSIAPCSGRPGWRRKTGCFARRAGPNSLQPHPLCNRCSKP